MVQPLWQDCLAMFTKALPLPETHPQSVSVLLLFLNVIYFLAVLSLHCCMGFSLVVASGGYSLAIRETQRGLLSIKNMYRSAQSSFIHHCQKLLITQISVKSRMGNFPSGAVDNNPPASSGDTGLIPGRVRSHMLWSNEAHVPQLLSLCSGVQ